MSSNKNLADALRAKDDEFYTTTETIEKELRNYDWTGKKVFCPCDYENSNFVSYFRRLGVDVRFRRNPFPVRLDLLGNPIKDRTFETDDEYWDGVNWSDVVVTNPPFSKFRDFIDILIASGKKFLVLGSNVACNFKNVFEYVQAGKLWAGYSCHFNGEFIRPDGSTKKVPVTWYTNLEKTPCAPFVAKNGYSCADLKARGLWKVYDDRPDILFVKAVADVPVDYDGLIAVPPNAFWRFLDGGWEFVEYDGFCNGVLTIDGVNPPMRIVIRRKPNQQRARTRPGI